MRADPVDLVGGDAGVGQGERHGATGLAAVGAGLDHVVGVRRGGVPQDLGEGRAPRATANSTASMTSSAPPSPMTNPSRSASNGREACPGSSLRPWPRARMMSNAPNASGDSGTSTPPAIAASMSPPRIAAGLADRDGAAGAGVRRRQDRAADVERDAEVRRGRPAEYREGERRGDRPEAALEVLLVLRLGERDPAEGRPREMPIRSASGAPATPGTRPASAIAIRPAASPNWLNRSIARADRASMKSSGSKSSTWAATWRPERRRVEAVDALDGARPARRPARNAGSPIPTAEIDANAGDDQRRRPVGHVGARRRDVGRASASARARKVASVRPAIGRVNAAVDERGEARRRAGGTRG